MDLVNLTVSIMYFRAFMTKYQYLFILGVNAHMLSRIFCILLCFLYFYFKSGEKRILRKVLSYFGSPVSWGYKFILVSFLRLVEYVTLKCVNTS